MDALMVGAAGLIAVAAATPGPNNLVVMRAAARAGIAAALPAIAGIIAGSLAMLLLVLAGADAAIAAEPRIVRVIAFAGAAYLCWLGASLVIGSFAAPVAPNATAPGRLPAGVGGLFGFQFLNPKSWVLVLTVSAAVRGGADAVVLPLAAMFVVIPAICLVLWSGLGVLLARGESHARFPAWLDRVMGLLLIGSALLLVFAD